MRGVLCPPTHRAGNIFLQATTCYLRDNMPVEKEGVVTKARSTKERPRIRYSASVLSHWCSQTHSYTCIYFVLLCCQQRSSYRGHSKFSMMTRGNHNWVPPNAFYCALSTLLRFVTDLRLLTHSSNHLCLLDK